MSMNTILLVILNILFLVLGYFLKRHVENQDRFNERVERRLENLEQHGCAFCQVEFKK